MTKILSEVLEANENYSANFGEKGKLALPPARSFAILTCMDARLDPAKYAGLAEGDAHVIRNAGGRASDDAIRSLVISYKLLGTQNSSSSTTPIAEWNSSPMTSCVAFSTQASKPPRSRLKVSRTSAKAPAPAPANTLSGSPSATKTSRPRRRRPHPQSSARPQIHSGPRLPLRRALRQAPRSRRRQSRRRRSIAFFKS